MPLFCLIKTYVDSTRYNHQTGLSNYHLDTRSRINLVELVTIGTLTASLVHPRETFRRAVMQGSASIIVAHNHPSGEVDPSDEDTKVTKLLFEAGNILGVTAR